MPITPPPIIERLPTMPISEMMVLWRNCIGYLSDIRMEDRWEKSKLVIKAIEDEWRDRGRQILNPDEYFDWPSTNAPAGHGSVDTDDWSEEGILSFMGYRVGETNGESTNIRHEILAHIFEHQLPPAFPSDYMKEWGDPSTVIRLKKIAESIAAFTRNAKRRVSPPLRAIDDWEKDLKFLYEKYYVDKFHFEWPST